MGKRAVSLVLTSTFPVFLFKWPPVYLEIYINPVPNSKQQNK